jgi:hypothetical protein
MVDQLLSLVKEYADEAVVKNPSVPDAKNGVAIQSIADGILSGLQSEAAGKGFGSIVGMLTSAGNVNNTVSKGVQQSVASSLSSKAGLGGNVAQSIAVQIVPSILNSLSHKSADASNSNFDIGGILSQLTGGKTAGLNIQSLIDSGIGNGDGRLDLNDVIALLGKKGGSVTTSAVTATNKKVKKVNSAASSQSGFDIGSLLGGLGKLFGGK